MGEYNEISKELGLDSYEDGAQSDGSFIVGHKRILEHVVRQIAQEKDLGLKKEKIDWVRKNSPPSGLGFSSYCGEKLVSDWWIDTMNEDLK